MKLSILLLLAITTTAFAIPFKRTSSLQIEKFKAKIYSNGTLNTLHFKIHDPSTKTKDKCHLSWNPTLEIQPGIEWNRCRQEHFEFGFRYGIGNIEDFSLIIQTIDSSKRGYVVINAYKKDPNWICKTGTKGIRERCEWIGDLEVPVT